LFDRVWLAEGEKELGIDISDEAIKQMKDNIVFTDKECVAFRNDLFLSSPKAGSLGAGRVAVNFSKL
jgi:hypothetical protein